MSPSRAPAFSRTGTHGRAANFLSKTSLDVFAKKVYSEVRLIPA